MLPRTWAQFEEITAARVVVQRNLAGEPLGKLGRGGGGVGPEDVERGEVVLGLVRDLDAQVVLVVLTDAGEGDQLGDIGCGGD